MIGCVSDKICFHAYQSVGTELLSSKSRRGPALARHHTYYKDAHTSIHCSSFPSSNLSNYSLRQDPPHIEFAGFHSFFTDKSLIFCFCSFFCLFVLPALNMFPKFFAASIVLGLTLQVSGHAIINPAVNVAGTARRADAKRVSTANPCGRNVNVATALSTATNAITMNGNTFTTTVTNFNRYNFSFLFDRIFLLT